MYCSKFSDAVRDLKEAAKNTALIARQLEREGKENDIQTGYLQMALLAAYAIEYGEKFFVPDGKNILANKTITPDIKSYLKLPYDCIAVLSECVHGEDRTKLISIAMTDKFLGGTPLADSLVNFTGEEIFVASVIYSKEQKKWTPLMMVVMDLRPLNADGYTIKRLTNAYFDMLAGELKKQGISYAKEMAADTSVIQNLCLMLGLKNVATTTINPDAKLVKKREKSNKLPLFSYKVLKVDNILWDTTESAASGGSFGCRSHMRRGHIRQLANGNRVWVRAALVKGSIPGFVGKEYHFA